MFRATKKKEQVKEHCPEDELPEFEKDFSDRNLLLVITDVLDVLATMPEQIAVPLQCPTRSLCKPGA